MSSQRNRYNRGNARGGSHDSTTAQGIWEEFNNNVLEAIMETEKKMAALRKQIVDEEKRIKVIEDSGKKLSPTENHVLDDLYRQTLRLNEEQRERLSGNGWEGIKSSLEVMKDLRREDEQNSVETSSRAATVSRSGMDFDGPSDSPIQSPAENRQVRKLGTSRNGSQPPSRQDGTPSETSERISKPKIVYAQGDEVAFKRKTGGKPLGKPVEEDWIQGRVVRVIGEGKSRRYDVEDPFPDPGVAPTVYKSSASQMVPIPPAGTTFSDYEVGKHVLALYPDTTTFYRAEVKRMLNGGSVVQLLFDDETAGELKEVKRRFVLDHKGI